MQNEAMWVEEEGVNAAADGNSCIAKPFH